MPTAHADAGGVYPAELRNLHPSGAISYKHRMSKHAVSVTLGAENLLWLRAQAGGPRRRSLSAVLDQLVSAARSGGAVHESTVRSVVGTISIDKSDPELLRADAAIRALFPAVCEDAAAYGRSRKSSTARARTRKRRG
jgi:hypothetical protein